MGEQYRYSGFKKDGWPSQYGDRYRVIFSFEETEKPSTQPKVTIEITGPRKDAWRTQQTEANIDDTDDNLIKILSGIARDALAKGLNLVEVKGDAYPNIDEFEKDGMDVGDIFTITSPEKPIGFQSELD
ncbi:MAG: hypothetical protein ACYSSO_05490 [Planctomycetota bacterium]|jgi:hypothetical protein